MFIQEINVNKEFLVQTCSSKHVKEKKIVMLCVINIIAKENLFLGLPIIQAIMRGTKKITQTYLSKYLSENHNVNQTCLSKHSKKRETTTQTCSSKHVMKKKKNLEVFIQTCEGKQRIIMLFVIHTIAKRKTKHLSIFDHSSNYDKKIKKNPLDMFIQRKSKYLDMFV